MKLTPVKSSNLEAVGHDPATQVLRVRFRGGATYDYQGVSAEAHRKFVGAESVGSHFHQHIRTAYPCALCEPEKKKS